MKMRFKLILVSIAFISSPACALAATPASQDWVLEQINKTSTSLTAQINGISSYLTPKDWSAICTTGSPASATGCFGTLSSTAFSKVNSAVGTYTTLANVPIANVPNSVFVKQFFGGSNVPASGNEISVSSGSSSAVCGVFTVTGTSLGDDGAINSSPGNANYQYGQYFVNIASGGSISNLQYYGGAAGEMVTSVPIYVLCLGYTYTSGTPPIAANLGNIHAT